MEQLFEVGFEPLTLGSLLSYSTNCAGRRLERRWCYLACTYLAWCELSSLGCVSFTSHRIYLYMVLPAFINANLYQCEVSAGEVNDREVSACEVAPPHQLELLEGLIG